MARRPPRLKRVGPRTNIRREPGAWTVTVLRQGQRYADYFSDAVWGGRERSLLAAEHFRDRLLLRISPDTRVRRRPAKGTRSVAGVVGVSLERHVVEGRIYRRYVASWQDAEKGSQRRRFQVERYGKEQAMALAIEARRAGVARRHAQELVRQRREAKKRLRQAAPMPRQVKDPLSRKGINMGRRRRRRVP